MWVSCRARVGRSVRKWGRDSSRVISMGFVLDVLQCLFVLLLTWSTETKRERETGVSDSHSNYLMQFQFQKDWHTFPALFSDPNISNVNFNSYLWKEWRRLLDERFSPANLTLNLLNVTTFNCITVRVTVPSQTPFSFCLFHHIQGKNTHSQGQKRNDEARFAENVSGGEQQKTSCTNCFPSADLGAPALF